MPRDRTMEMTGYLELSRRQRGRTAAFIGTSKLKKDAERRSFHLQPQPLSLRFFILTTVIAVLMMSACGTTHATLQVTAPSTVTAGNPFTISVMTIYNGKPDAVINSIVHFTSSDKAAVLPADYQFTSADAGSHTWPGGAVLQTPGSQTITATIIMATGINGSVTITVSP